MFDEVGIKPGIRYLQEGQMRINKVEYSLLAGAPEQKQYTVSMFLDVTIHKYLTKSETRQASLNLHFDK